MGLDCMKAQNKVESLICDDKNNPDLWPQDFKLNKFFGQLLQQTENKQNAINEQNKWTDEVRNVCDEADCLRTAYQHRMAELQQATTLCKAQEIVVFSCTLVQQKNVSLCASQDASPNIGYMQYRMGNIQRAPEIEFPQQKVLANKVFKYYSWIYPKGGTYGISFWNKESRYSLFLSKSAIGYNGAGVILSNGHPPVRVSFSKCVGDAIVFDNYPKAPSITFYHVGHRLGLRKAGSDISTYGPETDDNFGKNLEEEAPKSGEYEKPHRPGNR